MHWRRHASRCPGSSASRRARSSSRRGRPRRSTPPSGARPSQRREHRCSAPRSSTPPSATPRRVPHRSRTSRWTVTGRLDVDALRERLASASLPRPALVHCQWGNHEVGTLQRVHDVVGLCREAGVTVHVDAAAAAGHVPLDLGDLEADLVSLSAHKLGGVPGAGSLIVKRGSRFAPLLVGGEQERGRRAGLEADPRAPGLRRGGGRTGRMAISASLRRRAGRRDNRSQRSWTPRWRSTGSS